MKIKSKDSFLDVIQMERSWRRKELSNFKSLIYQSRNSHNHTLIRAAILLLYSHWEGYIKKTCESFFYYLNFKSYKYSDLKINYVALGMANEFNGNFPQKKFDSYMKAVKFTLSECNSKFKIDVEARVDTKSNLNTEVLIEILCMIGLNYDHFVNNKHHIDNRLLKYRNAIAHGERTDNNKELLVDEEEFYDLYDRINNLIDYFSDMIINYVETEAYKVAK